MCRWQRSFGDICFLLLSPGIPELRSPKKLEHLVHFSMYSQTQPVIWVFCLCGAKHLGWHLKKIKTDLLDVLALCRQEFNFLIVISLLSWDSQSASNSAKEKSDKVLCFFSSDGLSQQTYVHMITENWTILLLLYFPSGYLHDIKLSAQLLYCFGDIRTILNQWFDYFAFSLSDEIDQNNMVCWS